MFVLKYVDKYFAFSESARCPVLVEVTDNALQFVRQRDAEVFLDWYKQYQLPFKNQLIVTYISEVNENV